MRGFPKFLNTKQDYLNCMTEFPQETKKSLQALLDGRFSWFDTAVIEIDGVTDDTHRVVNTNDEKIQQELREDPNARIFKLGFTVAEVEELLND